MKIALLSILTNHEDFHQSRDACFTPPVSSDRAQCLKPLNCRCKHDRKFFLSVTLHFHAMRPL